MHSINILYFLLIPNYSLYVATEFVDFTFDAIPLGHSGLLISWKPNFIPLSEEPLIQDVRYSYIFQFQIFIIGDENIENYESVNSRKCFSYDGQCKILSLNESTLYEVTISQNDDPDIYWNGTCSVKVRTNFKSKRTPAKPYFEVIADPGYVPHRKVRWYPCGKEKICHDEESGTHFGISIKELDNMSTRKLIEVKQEEFLQDFIVALFLPGVLYEVIVYSVNGEHKMDSDPQEIFVKPKYATVQYVRVISLPDSSVLISWNPPKWSLDGKSEWQIRRYFTDFLNCSDPQEYSPFAWNEYRKMYSYIYLHENRSSWHGSYSFREQRRIFGVSPEIIYTYIIMPFDQQDGVGFEYRMKHQLQVYNPDLPIAKPDFNYKVYPSENETCYIDFQWLPCGKSFECKNTKPGSEYSFNFKPEPIYHKEDDEDFGYYGVHFDINLVYYVTAKSSNGNNSSESVKFIFKNCSEIPESTYLGEEIKNEL